MLGVSPGRRAARQDQAAWETRPPSAPSLRRGRGALGRCRAAGPTPGVDLELSGDAPPRSPHLLNTSRSSSSSSRSSTSACSRAEELDAAGEGRHPCSPRRRPQPGGPRSAPATPGTRPPSRECAPVRPSPPARFPELAHWLPSALRLPGRPRSSPMSAAQTRNWEPTPGLGSSPTWLCLPEAKEWDLGLWLGWGLARGPLKVGSGDLAAGCPAKASMGTGVWAEATERTVNFRGSTAELESSRPISPRGKNQ